MGADGISDVRFFKTQFKYSSVGTRPCLTKVNFLCYSFPLHLQAVFILFFLQGVQGSIYLLFLVHLFSSTLQPLDSAKRRKLAQAYSDQFFSAACFRSMALNAPQQAHGSADRATLSGQFRACCRLVCGKRI